MHGNETSNTNLFFIDNEDKLKKKMIDIVTSNPLEILKKKLRSKVENHCIYRHNNMTCHPKEFFHY